jgi:hypothetical protein
MSARLLAMPRRHLLALGKITKSNVVRDPRTHPDALIPDLSKPDPSSAFPKMASRLSTAAAGSSDISRRSATTTSRNRRNGMSRTARGNDISYPTIPIGGPHCTRMIISNVRPPLCDGGLSVNYDITTKTVSEWNVGCERCRGPGSAHVDHPARDTILNPSRLNYVHGNDACIQCHSRNDH